MDPTTFSGYNRTESEQLARGKHGLSDPSNYLGMPGKAEEYLDPTSERDPALTMSGSDEQLHGRLTNLMPGVE